MLQPTKPLIYFLVAIAGITFCFFMGWPFGNHLESYMWLPQFHQMDFTDCFVRKVQPVANYRPLGIATAWLTYKLSGGIALQQLVNWFFAIAAFALLCYHSRNRFLFSYAALVAGGAFFSGYIYLFHLQGVFYGPLQLAIAVFVIIADKYRTLTARLLWQMFFLSVIVAGFHPFILLVFSFFLFFYGVEAVMQKRMLPWTSLVFISLATIGLWFLLIPSLTDNGSGRPLEGWVVSFRLMEINKLFSAVAILFCGITLSQHPFTGRRRKIALLVGLMASGALFYFNLPLLFAWIVACIAKTIIQQKWTLVSILFSTLLLPLATGTGSPTYVVFVVMVAMYCMTSDVMMLNDTGKGGRYFSYAVTVVIILLGIISRMNIHLPVITKAILPIRAEQEKTVQLERILRWQISSQHYKRYHLELLDSANYPVLSKNMLDRRNRPPTNQFFLDQYTQYFNPANIKKGSSILLVTFGNQTLNDSLVMTFTGSWNGNAYVFTGKSQ